MGNMLRLGRFTFGEGKRRNKNKNSKSSVRENMFTRVVAVLLVAVSATVVIVPSLSLIHI